MIVIGLTGKHCAGKNIVAEFFSKKGIPIVDVDHIGHTVLQEISMEIEKTFGKDVLQRDSRSIDRRKLGEHVFSNPQALRKLELLLHPRMVRECVQLIDEYRQAGYNATVINAALLHRMGLDSDCDVVCYVKAPVLMRFVRSRRRDRKSVQTFFRILSMQRDISPKRISGDADLYLMNNCRGLSFIHRQVDSFCDTMGI